MGTGQMLLATGISSRLMLLKSNHAVSFRHLPFPGPKEAEGPTLLHGMTVSIRRPAAALQRLRLGNAGVYCTPVEIFAENCCRRKVVGHARVASKQTVRKREVSPRAFALWRGKLALPDAGSLSLHLPRSVLPTGIS